MSFIRGLKQSVRSRCLRKYSAVARNQRLRNFVYLISRKCKPNFVIRFAYNDRQHESIQRNVVPKCYATSVFVEAPRLHSAYACLRELACFSRCLFVLYFLSLNCIHYIDILYMQERTNREAKAAKSLFVILFFQAVLFSQTAFKDACGSRSHELWLFLLQLTPKKHIVHNCMGCSVCAVRRYSFLNVETVC